MSERVPVWSESCSRWHVPKKREHCGSARFSAALSPRLSHPYLQLRHPPVTCYSLACHDTRSADITISVLGASWAHVRRCIIFFDEVDAIGGARFDDGAGGDNEVQRTMLEMVNQLDGFDARGNIKVLMATNRPDTLDPALIRPGRLDRKIEFGLPDLEGRTRIFTIHSRTMNCERDIRFELLARLCPNNTGADIRSVCTEAGMFAIRARRKTISEKDFLDAVNKVIKGYAKFSATPKYMVYN